MAFKPGDLIQPTGRPEFVGRVLYEDKDNYIVRGAFARHDRQVAWEFAISKQDAEPYRQTFGMPAPLN